MQLDALNPAVDALFNGLPGGDTPKAILAVKSATEVRFFLLTLENFVVFIDLYTHPQSRFQYFF